jgi:hypothetical protein
LAFLACDVETPVWAPMDGHNDNVPGSFVLQNFVKINPAVFAIFYYYNYDIFFEKYFFSINDFLSVIKFGFFMIIIYCFLVRKNI